MGKKQGFSSALRVETPRGPSPARTRSRSEKPSALEGLLVPRRWRQQQFEEEPLVPSSGNLPPIMEGPDFGEAEGEDGPGKERRWGRWVKGQLSCTAAETAPSCRRSDFRLLLGVMAGPLAPIHVCSTDPLPHLSIKDTPIETSSAQYILQQYIAASGGLKLLRSIRSAYAMGKVRMVATKFETATRVIENRNASRDAESGGFVLWQKSPDLWYIELAVGGNKVHAGCNGKLAWRHTPWLGARVAKGPVRPLRRVLQGLDPLTTASMFANSRCIGLMNVNGEDCFILELCADPQTLKARSGGPAEVIRHVLFGYFSHRTGLLVHIEDSHLTRIQSSAGGEAVYWETSINSFIDDYHLVDGMMIAHSGHSVVNLFRFGEVPTSRTKTRMEEAWTIEEVAFNVPGLSLDCFIPPADIRNESVNEAFELPQGERRNNIMPKVAALEKSHDDAEGNILWKSNTKN